MGFSLVQIVVGILSIIICIFIIMKVVTKPNLVLIIQSCILLLSIYLFNVGISVTFSKFSLIGPIYIVISIIVAVTVTLFYRKSVKKIQFSTARDE